jgi:hypothetical protein
MIEILPARSPMLVRLETSNPRPHAGNRCPMALRRISLVLVGDFEAQQAHRQKTDIEEVRDLIFQMVAENPSWGAPRIHGELLMLSFEVSERTISRWMKRAPRALTQPSAGWPFFVTIGKPSRPWISSRFRRSPSA